MDMSKVRAFQSSHDNLLSFVDDSLRAQPSSLEIIGPFDTFDPGIVYVVEHRHEGEQMVRCFYRLTDDGTDLEAAWQTYGGGTLLATEHTFDLFGTDPVAVTAIGSDCFELLTESNILYVIDGQYVCPADRLARQLKLAETVYEPTARYTSYADGTFPEREEAQ